MHQYGLPMEWAIHSEIFKTGLFLHLLGETLALVFLSAIVVIPTVKLIELLVLWQGSMFV